MLGPITIGQQAFDEVFPQPKNRFTFLDAGPDADQALDRGRGRLQRRQRAHRRRLRERLHGGLRQLPELPLRAAGVLGRREPVRDGQHARAQRVRAHTRARDAADDRDDAPAGAPDDPPRERHHGADRRRARAPARHLPRGAGDPGALAVRHRLLDPDPGARGASRSSPSSPGSRPRSSRPAAPRGSTCSTPCTTSERTARTFRVPQPACATTAASPVSGQSAAAFSRRVSTRNGSASVAIAAAAT